MAKDVHISTTNVFKSTQKPTKTRAEKIEFAFVVTQTVHRANGQSKIAEVKRYKSEDAAEKARKVIVRQAKQGKFRLTV